MNDCDLEYIWKKFKNKHTNCNDNDLCRRGNNFQYTKPTEAEEMRGGLR